jgi:hypothetical protein
MGLILYKILLIKEIFYGLLIKGLAGLIVFIEAGYVPKNWIYLALIIVAMFPVSTYILKQIRHFWPEVPGFAYVVMSLVKMLLVPVMVILFFEKDHEHIEAFVIPLIAGYLILLAVDTKWKIKWLFNKRF